MKSIIQIEEKDFQASGYAEIRTRLNTDSEIYRYSVNPESTNDDLACESGVVFAVARDVTERRQIEDKL